MITECDSTPDVEICGEEEQRYLEQLLIEENGNTTENNYQQSKPDLTFAQQFLILPRTVQRRFWKQIFAATGFAVMTIAVMLTSGIWQYCVGFLFSLFLYYTGLKIVWDIHDGKINHCEVRVVKKSRATMDRQKVIAKEMNATAYEEDAIHTFYLPVTKQNSEMIDSNVILSIYYRPGEVDEIIAWEIVDLA